MEQVTQYYGQDSYHLCTHKERMNAVTVHLWTSAHNKKLPGHDSLGHIAIETLENYISFWPGTSELSDEDYERLYTIRKTRMTTPDSSQQKKRQKEPLAAKQLKLFAERPGELLPNFEADCDGEGAPPSLTATFYLLNKQLMLEKFEALKARTTHWRKVGKCGWILKVLEAMTPVHHDEERGLVHNCSSFVRELLKVAGLPGITGSSFTSQTASVTRPDDFLHVLKQAANEEEKYFQQRAKQQKKNTCCIS